MGSLPYAFSVHHFINSVGADAGFAAIIGLAVLILLYFAHARETASLREQLYEWAQRAQQLEARVSQLSRQLASLQAPGVPAEQRPPPAGARLAANTVAPARAPAPVHALAGAPAGVAAPALTAATKLIPTDPVVMEPAASAPVPAAELPVDATAVASPLPATAAGGANGSAQDHLLAGPGDASLGATPPPRIQIRHGATGPGRRPGVPPRNQPQRGGPSRRRRGIAIALVALVAVAAVAGLLILTSNGSKPKVASSTSGPSNARAATRHRAKTAPVQPAAVTVAVLNGTATPGLAGRVSLKLNGAGYKQGTVATAADQTRTATVVGYMPGHRGDALAVAAALKLGPASVQAVDSSTQAVACSAPGPCAADVVVTVGADLANTQ